MSVWALRFLLWFICILYTQPQNRFYFLYPFHIADICVAGAVGCHILACGQDGRPIVRFGPGTILTLMLIMVALVAQYMGACQVNTGWNSCIDILMKASVVLLLTEAMCTTIRRVWIVQAVVLFATIWWVKAGLRLSAAGATYAGDRIMGPAVSMVANPNGFAYMMGVVIPVYLYFYQQSGNKWLKWVFLALALSAVYIILQTGSRTGYLLLIVMAIAVLPKYGSQHKVALVAIGAGIFFASSYVGVLNIERFKSIPNAIAHFLEGGEQDPREAPDQDAQSAQERSMKNRDTWRLIKAYPMGVGMLPDEGLFGEEYPYAVGQVHCEILMAGRMMGFPGMMVYAGMLALVVINGWRVEQHCRGWWPAVADLGWTLRIQAFGFAVGGFFSPLPFNTPMMILVACASALWAIVRDSQPQQQVT
jgi:hypothetical protein